jgi:hypothetical protein
MSPACFCMDASEPLWLFVDPLDAAGIPYMVTGATAAILFGAPRLTNDLDLVVELTAKAANDLPTLFPEERFYCPPVDIIAAERNRMSRGHFNLIHHDTGYKADIYLAGADPLHAWGLGRRRELRWPDRRLWVAPPEYVIVRKLEFQREGGSPKHGTDIQAILATSGNALDWGFLEQEIASRGLSDLWHDIRRASG